MYGRYSRGQKLINFSEVSLINELVSAVTWLPGQFDRVAMTITVINVPQAKADRNIKKGTDF